MSGYFKKNSTKFLTGSIVILLLSLFLVSYPVGDLYNRTFLPQSEPVTELYFVSPESLPHTIAPKKTSHFSFRTVSHEALPTTYSYIATIDTPGSTAETLSTGSFTLADGESSDVPVSFAVTKPGVRSLVTIQLIGRTESLHFWVTS